jgi:hypothetical protein
VLDDADRRTEVERITRIVVGVEELSLSATIVSGKRGTLTLLT